MRLVLENNEWDTATDVECLLGHEECEFPNECGDDGVDDESSVTDFEDRILWNLRN